MKMSRPSGRRIGVICALAVLVALPAIVMGPLRHTGDSSADAASAAQAGPEVRRLYLAVFEREPDAGGWAHWTNLRVSGYSLEWVADRFAESGEFRLRYGTNVSDADFVRRLYRNVLDREPDPSGWGVWNWVLSQGWSRGRVMLGFSESPEFRNITSPIASGPATPPPTTPPPTTPRPTPPPTTPPPTTPPPTTPPPASGAGLFVSPGARGNCSAASPCGSINDAYQAARSGDVIQVAGGTYPGETIHGRGDATGFSRHVTVRPAPGASVRVGSLEVNGSRLRFEGLQVSGHVQVNSGVRFVDLVRLTVNGSVYVASANDILVADSTIRPSVDNDGLQIKPRNSSYPRPERVVVRGNTIGPIVASPGTTHIDGIQLIASLDVLIESNNITRCASQCIIGGAGNQNLRVADNRIELSSNNGGYNAINLQNIPNLKIVRNNIVHGAVELNPSDPGLLLDGNTIPLLRDCGPFAVNNVIRQTHCASQLPSSNRVG
jgi:Domain of unknown function (DUF4214)